MYNIKKAAQITGINPVTIRAWERRYGVITPSRTDGGFRVYSDQDLGDLKWVKSQIDSGVTAAQAMSMLTEKRKNTARDQPAETATAEAHMVTELYRSIEQLDAPAAEDLVNKAFSMFNINALFHRIIKPVLYRIGDGWESGDLTVVHEHFASHLITQRIYQFLRTLPVQKDKEKVLALCPPEEQHQIGLLLFTLFLQYKGHQVIFAGQNTPPDAARALISTQNIGILCMSVTIPYHIKNAEALIRSLQEFPDLNILAGGHAFNYMDEKYKKYMIGDSPEEWENWYNDVYLN